MGMPAYKASGTFTVSTTSITPPYPTAGSAPVAGDIALLVVESENQTISLTTANGFVEIGAQANKAAGSAGVDPASRLAVYWKRCVGGDSAPVVADSGDHTTGQIHLFTGVRKNGNPWNIYTEGNDSGVNDNSAVIPGETTTVSNCLVVLLCSCSWNTTSSLVFSSWSNAMLANLTERTDNVNTAGLGGGHGMATGELVDADTYLNTTVTLAATSYKGTMSIALEGEASPNTPTLNSPAANATGVSRTPTLNFTGADPNGDTIRYNVQIGPEAAETIDSYSESNQSGESWISDAAHTNKIAHNFTAASTYILGEAKIYCYKSSSPTGAVTVTVCADSGGSPGTVLATADAVDASALATSFALFTFTFSGANKITLSPSTTYWLVLEYSSGANPGAMVRVGFDNTSPTHAGNVKEYLTGAWTTKTYDMCFYVNQVDNYTLNKVSGTDVGFTAGDPYTSNVAKEFTVQAGDTLAASTQYYWRVRAIDPLGSNTYGSWSSPRKFTTVSASTPTTKTLGLLGVG
jgi:hypothetical protein